LTNKQLEQQRSAQRIPPPRHTEIGTVSLTSAFHALHRSCFFFAISLSLFTWLHAYDTIGNV